MRRPPTFSIAGLLILSMAGVLAVAVCQQSAENTREHAVSIPASVAVGPQYDSTHVYVAPEDFDRFVASVLATFGGTKSKQVITTITPTASRTMSQLILTPVGPISVFGFQTPTPYPFGSERIGHLARISQVWCSKKPSLLA
jgi:hypothetical protein